MTTKETEKKASKSNKDTEKKAGRPTKYNEKKHLQLGKLCAKACMTDKEICEELDIAESTLYLWKNKYKGFSEALQIEKDKVDERVEKSLYSLAVGYEEDDIKIFQFQGVDVQVPFVKKYKPDLGAITLWLKNRQPDKWRDKQEIDLKTEINVIYADEGDKDL